MHATKVVNEHLNIYRQCLPIIPAKRIVAISETTKKKMVILVTRNDEKIYDCSEYMKQARERLLQRSWKIINSLNEKIIIYD